MATPKKRLSHMRSGTRRSQLHITLPSVIFCPKCHSPRLPHTVCQICGTYRGRAVIDVTKKVAVPATTSSESQ